MAKPVFGPNVLSHDQGRDFVGCTQPLRNLSNNEIDAMILRRGIRIQRGYPGSKRIRGKAANAVVGMGAAGQ